MKEAIVYDMYQYLDVDASLYNYAKISHNGEYWGVYLALEAVEESFLDRNYGTVEGDLYKPESMDMGGGGDMAEKFENMEFPEDFEGMEMPQMPGNTQDTEQEKTDDTGNTETSEVANDTKDVETKENQGNMQMSENAEGMERPEMPENAEGMEMPQMPENVEGEETSETIENTASSEDTAKQNNMKMPGNMDMSGKGNNFMNGSGADLNYSDDELSSYSTIWDGAVTDVTKADQKKVVNALKNISEGTDLETYLDIDNILKYMAVHTFAVNQDSLTGNMAHNYYLYQNGDQLNILPWDFNMSFGGFGGMAMGGAGGGESDSASEMINFTIDTPFAGTDFFDKLLENSEYLERYHNYFQQLVDEYVNGGRFDQVYNRIRTQIDELVAEDPTAFYTYDEYETGAEMLYDTVKLRAESIQGQLDGTIPSTSDGQKENPDALVDASAIDVSVMGEHSMGQGGNGGFGPNMNGEKMNADFVPDKDNAEGSSDAENATIENTENATIENTENAETSTKENVADSSEDVVASQGQQGGGMPQQGGREHANDSGNAPQGMQMPNAGMDKEGIMILVICLLGMIGALIFAKIYKRK